MNSMKLKNYIKTSYGNILIMLTVRILNFIFCVFPQQQQKLAWKKSFLELIINSFREFPGGPVVRIS